MSFPGRYNNILPTGKTFDRQILNTYINHNSKSPFVPPRFANDIVDAGAGWDRRVAGGSELIGSQLIIKVPFRVPQESYVDLNQKSTPMNITDEWAKSINQRIDRTRQHMVDKFVHPHNQILNPNVIERLDNIAGHAEAGRGYTKATNVTANQADFLSNLKANTDKSFSDNYRVKDLINFEDYQVNEDIYKKQLGQLETQFADIKKRTGVDIQREIRTRTGGGNAMFLTASKDGHTVDIGLLHQEGMALTYGHDTVLAHRGGSIPLQDIKGFTVRTAQSDMEHSALMPVGERVNAGIHKVLKTNWDKGEARDQLNALKKSMSAEMDDIRSPGLRSDVAVARGEAGIIKSTVDLRSVLGSMNPFMNTATGYNFSPDEQVSMMMTGLKDNTSRLYQLAGGFTKDEYNRHSDIMELANGKYQLKNFKKGEATIALQNAQYTLVEQKRYNMTQGSDSAAILKDGTTLSRALGLDDSKPIGKTTFKAISGTVPISGANGKLDAIRGFSSNGLGVLPGIPKAGSIGEKLTSGTNDLAFIRTKVVGLTDVISPEFKAHLDATGLDFSKLTTREIKAQHRIWASQNGGLKKVGAFGSGALEHNLPFSPDQAHNMVLANDAILKGAISKPVLFNKKMQIPVGSDFYAVTDYGTHVNENTIVGFIENKTENIKTAVLAGYEGKFDYEKTTDKIGRPKELRLKISGETSLGEESSMVFEGKEGSITKVSVGTSSQNVIANELMESRQVYTAGADGLENSHAAMIINNQSLKSSDDMTGHMLIPLKNSNGKYAMVTIDEYNAHMRDATEVKDVVSKKPGANGMKVRNVRRTLGRMTAHAERNGYKRMAMYNDLDKQLKAHLLDKGFTMKDEDGLMKTLRSYMQSTSLHDTKGLNAGMKMIDQVLGEVGESSVNIGQFKYQFLESVREKLARGIAHSLIPGTTRHTKALAGFNTEFDNLIEAESRLAVSEQRMLSNPGSKVKSSFRDIPVDMARRLLNEASGQAHFEFNQLERMGSNKYRSIFTGGIMMMGGAMDHAPIKLMGSMRLRGQMISVDASRASSTGLRSMESSMAFSKMQKDTSGKITKNFNKAIDEFKGIAISLEDTAVANAVDSSVHFDFQHISDIDKDIFKKIIADGGLKGRGQQIGQFILDKGVYLPSNAMLGRGNLENNVTGEFFRQRSSAMKAVRDLLEAMQGTGADRTNVISGKFKALIDAHGQNAMDVMETLLSGQGRKNLFSAESNGAYARSLTNDYHMGNIMKGTEDEIAHKMSTMYVSPDEYFHQFGHEYSAAKDRFAVLTKHPNLALSNEQVLLVRVSDQLQHQQIAAHSIISEMFKADNDRDSLIWRPITEGHSLGKLGYEHTASMAKQASQYYNDVAPILKELGANGGSAVKSENWRAALDAVVEHGKTTGLFTNRIGRVNTMTAVRAMEMGAFAQGATAEITSKAKNMLAVSSILRFMGEGAIRSFKLDKAGMVINVSHVSDMLNALQYGKATADEAGGILHAGLTNMLGQGIDDKFISDYEKLYPDRPFGEIKQLRKQGKYALVLGDKRSVFSDEFIRISDQALDDAGNAIHGLRLINDKKLVEGIGEVIKSTTDASPLAKLQGETFELMTKKKIDPAYALEMLNNTMGAATSKESFSMVEAIQHSVGLFQDEPKGPLTAGGYLETAPKQLAALKAEQETIVKAATTAKAASVVAGEEAGIMGSKAFLKYGHMAHGAIGGALMVAGVAAISGMFGSNSGEMEAPLSPVTPMNGDSSIQDVTSLDTPGPYIRNQSAISSRMQVKGRGSPRIAMNYASGTGQNGYISYQDKSLNDAQYLSQYKNRTTGRY